MKVLVVLEVLGEARLKQNVERLRGATDYLSFNTVFAKLHKDGFHALERPCNGWFAGSMPVRKSQNQRQRWHDDEIQYTCSMDGFVLKEAAQSRRWT